MKKQSLLLWSILFVLILIGSALVLSGLNGNEFATKFGLLILVIAIFTGLVNTFQNGKLNNEIQKEIVSKELNFWLVITVLLVFGITLMIFHNELANKFGEALVVAGVLASTVDVFLKNRLASDVFKAVLGHHLPIELQHQINEICSIQIYRKRLEIRLKIEDHKTDPSKMIYHFDAKYKVNNISVKPQLYSYKVAVERHTDIEQEPEPFQIKQVGANNILNADGHKDDFELDANQNGGDLGRTEDRFRVYKKDVYIPPLTNNGNSESSFWLVTKQIFPRNCKETITFNDVVIGVDIEIVNPPSWLDVNVTTLYPNKIIRNGNRFFKSEIAFLPGQVLKIDLKEKKESGDSTVNEQEGSEKSNFSSTKA